MFKHTLKKSKIPLMIGCSVVALGMGFLVVKAIPDFFSDTFTSETNIAQGTEKVEIDTTAGQVKLASCYYTDGTWSKIADTTVRNILSLSSSATSPKDIYCDNSNCVLWTDEGGTPPSPLCIATNSGVYGNLLWSRSDSSSGATYGPLTLLSGDQIGGTHPSGLTVGNTAVAVGGKNWLNRYYTLGTFSAMDVCKTKGSAWRLPNILELDSIRDMTTGAAPYTRLPGISAAYYWSSSENDASSAYNLNFSNGGVDLNAKSSYYYVRCVRGQ